ncbi:hypothetical protein Vadar_012007 [Vaccinium darrowii]|uniref:Uncharacterized protein n=1 Tax=Vaccinium darrowii TaxID=229202 RepID=A0ACB7XZX4_9ERIC|nr:hypothetical protein Vadar_012007 [Vaccinium darrowii]
MAFLPISSAFTASGYGGGCARKTIGSCGSGGLVIECSSRPKKKATAHHKKTRPRKTQPWDIKRKPTVYAPLPPMPPEWTLVTDFNDVVAQAPSNETTQATVGSSEQTLLAPGPRIDLFLKPTVKPIIKSPMKPTHLSFPIKPSLQIVPIILRFRCGSRFGWGSSHTHPTDLVPDSHSNEFTISVAKPLTDDGSVKSYQYLS